MTEGNEAGVLEPCPFCGDVKPSLLSNIGKACNDHAWVHCTVCMTDGPEKDTEAEAVTAWNSRTQPPPLSDEGD